MGWTIAAPAPTPRPTNDDELYSDGEGSPLSSVPLAVQLPIAAACTFVVVWVIIVGCCLAKDTCRWHAQLVQVAEKIERKDAAKQRADAARARREAREGEESPLLRGAFARLCALFPAAPAAATSERAVVRRQA